MHNNPTNTISSFKLAKFLSGAMFGLLFGLLGTALELGNFPDTMTPSGRELLAGRPFTVLPLSLFFGWWVVSPGGYDLMRK